MSQRSSQQKVETVLNDQSKAERVYIELRRRIRELILPPGAPIRKEEIALELGVSRAPVSDAISRLAEEALVEVFPQHGSFVAPIRAETVRESMFIRTALEVEAARRVTQTSDENFLESLQNNLEAQAEALTQNDLVIFYELDEEMHAIIFGALNSQRVERLLNAARAPLDRPRRLALPEIGRAHSTLEEHRCLVEAIRSGDPEFAAAAMRAHLNMVAKAVERELDEIDASAEQE